MDEGTEVPEVRGDAVSPEISASGASDGLPVNECGHTYEASSYHGPVRRAYTGLFCPDCGARIEAPGKTRPFKLKPHQR